MRPQMTFPGTRRVPFRFHCFSVPAISSRKAWSRCNWSSVSRRCRSNVSITSSHGQWPRSKAENADDFLERESETLRLSNELESSQIGVGVDTIPGFGPRRPGKQSLPFVETHCLYGHPDLLRHVSDSHVTTLNPEVSYRLKLFVADKQPRFPQNDQAYLRSVPALNQRGRTPRCKVDNRAVAPLRVCH